MPSIANLYYHEYEGTDQENRPPVILIHGAGGNHLYWPAEVRRLSSYRVLAPDLPGHGKSEGSGLQSVSSYAQALRDWMDALEIRRAVLVGHSMGGAIALQMAAKHPERIAALVLVSTGARLRVAADLLENTRHPTTFSNAVGWILERSFGPEAPPRLVELAGSRMLETRPSVLYGDFLACDLFDISDQLTEIRQPALVLHGSEDRMTPPRLSQFLAGSLPNARLASVPGAGHMLMLERPEAVAAALQSFLNDQAA